MPERSRIFLTIVDNSGKKKNDNRRLVCRFGREMCEPAYEKADRKSVKDKIDDINNAGKNAVGITRGKT